MVAVVLAPVAVQDFFVNGVPAVGAKLFLYQAGTLTKINTYTDEGGGTVQSNPILMNARGEPQNSSNASVGIWIPPGTSYKAVLAPSTDTDPPSNPIWTVDNLSSGGQNGTAASQNIGTSGANVPLLNGVNTWSGAQTFQSTIDAVTTINNFGLRVREDSTDTQALIQFTNNAGNSQIGLITCNNAGVLIYNSDIFCTLTAPQTMTNKRINPRVVSVTTGSTITPTSDTADQYEVSALASAATVAAPSGTPVDAQKLIIRITDNGTSRALTWNAAYNDLLTQLPGSTTISVPIYIGCIYNSAISKWDVVAVA